MVKMCKTSTGNSVVEENTSCVAFIVPKSNFFFFSFDFTFKSERSLENCSFLGAIISVGVLLTRLFNT